MEGLAIAYVPSWQLRNSLQAMITAGYFARRLVLPPSVCRGVNLKRRYWFAKNAIFWHNAQAGS
ncbi:hypothetical protein ABMD26_003615 [Pseudomonas sp. PvP001]